VKPDRWGFTVRSRLWGEVWGGKSWTGKTERGRYSSGYIGKGATDPAATARNSTGGGMAYSNKQARL